VEKDTVLKKFEHLKEMSEFFNTIIHKNR